jgi:hypothetical protein
LLIKTVEDVV